MGGEGAGVLTGAHKQDQGWGKPPRYGAGGRELMGCFAKYDCCSASDRMRTAKFGATSTAGMYAADRPKRPRMASVTAAMTDRSIKNGPGCEGGWMAGGCGRHFR